MLDLDYERLSSPELCAVGRAKWVGILWFRKEAACVWFFFFFLATQLSDSAPNGQVERKAGPELLQPWWRRRPLPSQQNERCWRAGTGCCSCVANPGKPWGCVRLAWSTTALPNHRAPDYHKTNLHDAELSPSKRLPMLSVRVQLGCTCTCTRFAVSLVFDLSAGGVRAGARRGTMASHLGGKQPPLFPELALFASDSDSCSPRTALCIMQSHCHHEPSQGEAQWKKWR